MDINDRTYAVVFRREVWRDFVPPRTLFSARSGGEATAAGGKKGYFGAASPPPDPTLGSDT
jgi:hypothetical protein